MKDKKQNALQPLPCHFAILANRLAIFLSRKLLHSTKKNFFSLSITCTTTLIIKTKIILIAILRIANVRVQNHFGYYMHVFASYFPDINYDASDEQVNKSAGGVAPT